MKSGIYIITNLINKKSYYGSSYDITGRWSDHKWMLKNNCHDNPYLQNSWNKYGTNKLSEIQVSKIRFLYKTNSYTYIQLAKIFIVSKTCIQNIINNKTWRNIHGN